MIICSNRVEAIDESCGKCHNQSGWLKSCSLSPERERKTDLKSVAKTQADHQIIIIK